MANAAIIELDRNCAKVVEDIVKLERKIFPKHESLASFFENELKKKNTGLLYLQVNGELAGYVMYSLPSSLYASITKLAVKEQWRRQGHGEALFKAAIEKCRRRKVSRIMLHVDPLRTPALNLYKKHGFQVDCLVEGYYSSDRNAYRMYLDFDSS
ncbi:putative [ribosomal protein S18]-alanine N-acetyltransferase [Trifolium repens]|nr:putative [ribosomal protein S18]-alanine N-acetyltransferase [Trifolium repens]